MRMRAPGCGGEIFAELGDESLSFAAEGIETGSYSSAVLGTCPADDRDVSGWGVLTDQRDALDRMEVMCA